ncbi:hypothetical protein WG906_06100 [Pedobacter sp. P351]|uniref:hypothetical protein n=1 Tax=Pedobacter superstes TaxID=3133441 RepID=UPI0030B0868B
MKFAIKELIFVTPFLIAVNCFAQPSDLTHPANKNRSGTVSYSILRIPEGLNPIIIYDGITLFNVTSLKELDRNTINSVKRSQNTVLDNNKETKFNGVIEITTKDEVNASLKYIKEKTEYWIKEHPLAVFYLNDELLLTDLEKLNKLTSLKIENIKAIRPLNSYQGTQLLGKIGEYGVMQIMTK